MHQSSINIMSQFRNIVLSHFKGNSVRVLDVGSYGVNGTYKEIFSDESLFTYTGLDLQQGPNVDYIPQDPYHWPELNDESFDVIISGQAFEHIEFPWLIIEEIYHKLKKNGLICIIAPSRGPEHKYPVDCWRYYPDGFRALAKWAGLEVLDAKTTWSSSGFTDGSDQWGDSFCILWKKGAPETTRKVPSRKPASQREINRNNPLESAKADTYYSFARSEIIDAIVQYNLPAKRILEIGCAGGSTGKKLKETVAVDSYVGVEISESAAVVARQHLDKVIVADIEKTDLLDHGLRHGDFDLVIALDVLEHLYNPWDILVVLRQFLKLGGHVIASIPNIQNISIVNSLVHGSWKYESAGILDATHLRFFTINEIERLFSGAGLSITRTDSVFNPPIDLSTIKETGNRLDHDKLCLSDLSKEDVLRLFAYQYIIIAKNTPLALRDTLSDQTKEPAMRQSVCITGGTELSENNNRSLAVKGKKVSNLTSIVILTFNQLNYTKECLESIRKHTPEQHELIIVDNGSIDGTVKWLKKIVKENPHYRLIENKSNLGFARGCNQGIAEAAGEYVLLLNNDVVVTEGWLSGMLECLNSAPDIGIVGPMTNYISGPQKVADADYKTMDRMHEYAKAFREKHDHRRLPMRRIVGFCMLFRTELAKRIGMLDESFGSGNYEDDDYCLRATLSGFRNCVAGDVFIHHYGSKTFIGNKINYGTAMARNKKIFDDKWRLVESKSSLGRSVITISALENAQDIYQRGEIDKAIEIILGGITNSQDDERIYYLFAEILIDAKRYQDALEAINSLPEPARTSPRYLEIIAICKEGLTLYDEADEYADKALAGKPDAVRALNIKGALAYKREKRSEAEAFFLNAMNADPGYGESYTNLGVLKWAHDKHEALTLIEKGFMLAPLAADSISTYYSAISDQGAFEQAEGLFREVKDLYPRYKKNRFLLIDTLIQQGKHEAAMDETEQTMLVFGIDDGILAAALALRKTIGPKMIDKNAKGTLSLSMIAKNEEGTLARCLMSIRDVVDEMIIVDTGSIDRTIDVAKAFGAQVYDFPWTGDFSEARNASLAKASGDWLLVLDADETISPLDRAALVGIVKEAPVRPAAYSLLTRNYTNQVGSQGFTANDGRYPNEEAGLGWYPSIKVRLFVNNKGIKFEKPVHEFVESTVQKAGLAIKSCEILVHHYGRLDAEKNRIKGEAYYQLGLRKWNENKDDVKALFELAVQAGELGKYDEAAELWRKVIKIKPDDSLALFNLGHACMELGKFHDGLAFSEKAMKLNPSAKEAAVNFANCALHVGDVKQAVTVLEGVLRQSSEFPSAMAALTAAYYVDGSKDKGLAILQQLRKKGFDCSDFMYDIAKGLVSVDRIDHALALLTASVETGNIHNGTRDLVTKCHKILEDRLQEQNEAKPCSPGS